MQQNQGEKLIINELEAMGLIEEAAPKNIKSKKEKTDKSVDRLTYTFYCFGHPNMRANHVKTLEFTKDSELGIEGDCIVGLRSTFEYEKLMQFKKKVKFICELFDPQSDHAYSSIFKCTVNPEYASETELVLRKSFFNSYRTFGHNLDRGSNHLDRKIVELLKANPDLQMKVTILDGWY